MRVGYITLSQRQSSNPGNGNSLFNFSNESQSRFICIEADDLSILFGFKKTFLLIIQQGTHYQWRKLCLIYMKLIWKVTDSKRPWKLMKVDWSHDYNTSTHKSLDLVVTLPDCRFELIDHPSLFSWFNYQLFTKMKNHYMEASSKVTWRHICCWDFLRNWLNNLLSAVRYFTWREHCSH